MTGLFEPLLGMAAVVEATNDRAWVAALCETETALARACSSVGLIDLTTALEIGAAAAALAMGDPTELGWRAVADGNPVIPLVARMREQVRARAGDQAAAAVHLGATSQDVLDTAAMLITLRALEVIGPDLAGCADGAAALAGQHRDTAMAARTLLQQAEPTTFGAVAANWGAGLDGAVARLVGLRTRLPVQLGGAAGNLAALYPHGFAVQEAFADELGLAVPNGVWHTERGIIAELAGALGQACAAASKVATDIVLLAQTELGEVREAAPGGSSAMAHKQNPVAAVTARAAAAQAPGLVATLLAAAPELQRGAGAWHAEWPALINLLRATGGAAARLRASLSELRVDAAAMSANLAKLGERARPVPSHAADLVDRYLLGRAR